MASQAECTCTEANPHDADAATGEVNNSEACTLMEHGKMRREEHNELCLDLSVPVTRTPGLRDSEAGH